MRAFLLAWAVLLLLVAAPAFAAPRASFTVLTPSPTVGQPVTFRPTSVPDRDPLLSAAWDFENDGQVDLFSAAPMADVVHTFDRPGLYYVRLLVLDRNGGDTFVGTVSVAPPNAPPVAQMSISPSAPVVGQEVLFQSFSFDPDGSLAAAPPEWDLDYDGTRFDVDLTGVAPTTTFSTPGSRVIALRVRDDRGLPDIETRSLDIGPAPSNALPTAQFSVSPSEPRVGEQVALRSFSYDPDGSIVSQRWDLDGDGDFDENVTGPSAFTAFATAGSRIVRLEVRDSAGGVQTATQAVNVKARDGRVTASRLSLMSPFPIVRMAGSVYPHGVRVKALEARAPRGSTVTVRCTGKSCPAKRIRKTAGRKLVRFKAMTRFLPAGTVISVWIRKSGQIGKYTRWLIRGGKLPKRTDLCLYPGRRKGSRCPAG